MTQYFITEPSWSSKLSIQCTANDSKHVAHSFYTVYCMADKSCASSVGEIIKKYALAVV